MAKRNSFMARMDAAVYESNLRVQNFATLLMKDIFVISMQDAGISRNKIAEVLTDASQTLIDFNRIWNDDTKDREYAMAVLDRKLQHALGESDETFEPFEVRFAGLVDFGK